MKTFRLLALLALAVLAAACSRSITAPAADASTTAASMDEALDTGQGQLGGGTRK